MSDTKTQIQTIVEELAIRIASEIKIPQFGRPVEAMTIQVTQIISPILTAALEVAEELKKMSCNCEPPVHSVGHYSYCNKQIAFEALSSLNSALKQAKLPEIV